MPANDCRSSVEMRYTLLQACPPPSCTVELKPFTDGEPLTYSCVCGGGGGAP